MKKFAFWSNVVAVILCAISLGMQIVSDNTGWAVLMCIFVFLNAICIGINRNYED